MLPYYDADVTRKAPLYKNDSSKRMLRSTRSFAPPPPSTAPANCSRMDTKPSVAVLAAAASIAASRQDEGGRRLALWRTGGVSRRRKQHGHEEEQAQGSIIMDKRKSSSGPRAMTASGSCYGRDILADDCSVQGSPSLFNVRANSSSSSNAPAQWAQPGKSYQADHPTDLELLSSPSRGRQLVPPASGSGLSRGNGLGVSGNDLRRIRTPGDGARRTPPTYKLDPCAALDLATSSSAVSKSGHPPQPNNKQPEQQAQRPQSHRRSISLSTSDLRNTDIAMEKDPAGMRAEIRRLRSALVELYRGPNRLVGGSQFRTLVRDTDAPYSCGECEGLKAFIRELQRDQRVLRDQNFDLETKVTHFQPCAEELAQADRAAKDLRASNESLMSLLNLREREVEALRLELSRARVKGEDSTMAAAAESRGEVFVAEKDREVEGLKDKLHSQIAEHGVERSQLKRIIEGLQARTAPLQKERGQLASLIATMRGMEVGSLDDTANLAEELAKIQEELDMRREEAEARGQTERAMLDELSTLRNGRTAAGLSLQLAQASLVKARGEVAGLTKAMQRLQQDFDKVAREKESLTETLDCQTSSVRKGLESILNSSAVRVCVVAPTVNVQLSQHTNLIYKSSIAKEKIRDFVEHKVLPRFVSLMVQEEDDHDDNDGANQAEGGDWNEGGEGEGKGRGSSQPGLEPTSSISSSHQGRTRTEKRGNHKHMQHNGKRGLDVWVETMLMEIKTVIEGNITRIFHEDG